MIIIDYSDKRPIYEQIAGRFQALIVSGVMEADEKLPSVRSLAVELSINPNTIQRAYGELERRGYTYSIKGRGSFVGSIRKLRQARKEEMEKKLGGLAKEAKTIGMMRDEFVTAAGQAYDGHPREIEDREKEPVQEEPVNMPFISRQESGEALRVESE